MVDEREWELGREVGREREGKGRREWEGREDPSHHPTHPSFEILYKILYIIALVTLQKASLMISLATEWTSNLNWRRNTAKR
jgi:hypothetical protein